MKVQVNLSDEMVERIDILAKSIGVSRSAYCAMLIGQGVDNTDKSYNMISTMIDKISTDMLKTKVPNQK